MEAALEQSAWRRQAPDLSGRWERDSSQNVEDCVAFLEAHGHDTATAVSKTKSPYCQLWERPQEQGDGPGAWKVTTFKEDGITPRRVLVYPIGKFEEQYQGSTGSDGVALRETCWEKAGGLWSHVTRTHTHIGKEETRRTVTGGDWNTMEVKRTFWPTSPGNSAVSATEIFLRK